MQRYEFCHYLCIVFRDKVLEYNKESALYSLKSPNYQEVYTRLRGQLILVGCPIVRIYGCLMLLLVKEKDKTLYRPFRGRF